MRMRRIAERRLPHPFADQPIEVDIGENALRRIEKPLGLGEPIAVFIMKAMPSPARFGGEFPVAWEPIRSESAGQEPS